VSSYCKGAFHTSKAVLLTLFVIWEIVSSQGLSWAILNDDLGVTTAGTPLHLGGYFFVHAAKFRAFGRSMRYN